ncbi:MAG: cyclic nucleotide-binding domain-containing protein [Phycisphaeraceae bacterium]|nr:cyclic nucleotide-binding domain-containing protein [Phycisphaeraceae bacterium]
MSKTSVLDRPKRWDIPFFAERSQRDQTPEVAQKAQEELVQRLLVIEPFAKMENRKKLKDILHNDTRLLQFHDGDVIVRKGDYGNSAFITLVGSVKVLLDDLDPTLLGRKKTKTQSRWRSFTKLFTLPRMPESRDTRLYPQLREGSGTTAKPGTTFAIQDIPNVLKALKEPLDPTDPKSPLKITNTVTMETGVLFGELAALGRIPRAASCVAQGDTQLLEIRWQGLRDLRQLDNALRQYVDQLYRERGLKDALQNAAQIHLHQRSDTQLQPIVQTAEFATYGSYDWYGSYQALREENSNPLTQEPVIAAQGHYPNGLIIIRAGFARISCKQGSGEHTLGYLSKGDVYGLAELAHNAKHPNDPTPLTTTLRAIGYVDIVRVPTATAEQLIIPNIPVDQIPVLQNKVSSPPSPSTPTQNPSAEKDRIAPVILESLVENRFINGSATMLIDLDRCTRCDDCVRACSSGHDNNPRFVRHGTTIDHYLVANACMHCADPVCMIGCPTGAIHRTTQGGEVVINDITCIGCGVCASSCPYENIRMVEIRDQLNSDAIVVNPNNGKPIAKATKCDLCTDHHGGPACERACPHDALKRVDMREMDILSQWFNR